MNHTSQCTQCEPHIAVHPFLRIPRFKETDEDDFLCSSMRFNLARSPCGLCMRPVLLQAGFTLRASRDVIAWDASRAVCA